MKPQKEENEHGDDGLPDIDVDTGEKITEAPPKESHTISDLIELFKSVDPSYKRYYKNKTERDCLKRLLAAHGKEKLSALITALPEIISKPYAPRITTPYQLETKMGQLKAFFDQNKETKQKTAWHIL